MQNADLPIPFPIKGTDASTPISKQMPLTTPDAQNVRAFDPRTDRNRGASRCGLIRFCPDVLASKSVQEIFHAVQVSGQTTPFGSGDAYIPESTAWNFYDLNGDPIYEDRSGSPSPVHGSFADDGSLFVALPGPNGIEVQKLQPRANFPPPIANRAAAPPPDQAVQGFKANVIANDPRIVDLIQFAGDASTSRNLGDFTVKTNELLVVIVARYTPSGAGSPSATLAGAALTASGGYSGANLNHFTLRLKPAQELAGSLIVSNSAAEGKIAIVAFKIIQLANSAIDQSATDTGSSATPLSASITTTVAKSVVVGSISTQGPSTDTEGTWGALLLGHQRVGTTGGADATNVTLATAYRIAFKTGAYTASKTGITSRQWFAKVENFS